MNVRTQGAAYAGGTGGIERIYRRDEMPALTGYCIDHLYQLVNEGKFPKPIPLGARAVGWLGSEIALWQRQRIAERDGQVET